VSVCQQDADWRSRESAILALGAISEGCHRGLVPYLGDLVGMLGPKLSDPRPLVRSITCWALSRYSHWLVQSAAEPNSPGQAQLDSVFTVMGGQADGQTDRQAGRQAHMLFPTPQRAEAPVLADRQTGWTAGR
jgi:transportin-1